MPFRFWMLVLLLHCVACQQPDIPVLSPTETAVPTSIRPTETVAPTETVLVEPTATQRPTDAPTNTPAPTATSEPTSTPTPIAELTLEMLRNGSYPTTFVESGVVQLVNGEFQQAVSADSPLRAYARLSDIYAFGDFNEDGLDEAAVILATNTGGTGIFYELFVVEMVDDTPKVVTSVLLGDRVNIRAMSIDEAEITLDLTQRGRGDAPCCPTEEAQFTYELADRMLVKTGEVTASSAEIATAGDTVNAFMQTYLQDPTGLSSLDFVTEQLKAEIEQETVAQMTGIADPFTSYFYGIQQRSATAVRVKTTLNQAIVRNIFFDLDRVEDRWLISNIDRARPATSAFGDNPCRLTTTEENAVYQRPRVQAGLFATLTAETSVIVNAQTATGWFGFEPGMAQAANTGVFRYRWIAPNGNYTLSETCANLPLVVAVQATQCYTMPLVDVSVYQAANLDASIVGTLPAGTSFAAVLEQDAEWVRVNLMDSSLFVNEMGWISAETLNLNGASCEAVLAAEEAE